MAGASGDFQLSASLHGHEKDVRAVCFPSPDAVFTASRDCTVQAWHASGSPPVFVPTLLAQAPYFFNSLAFLPPAESRPKYPHGLVLAGSQGQTIEVRRSDANVAAPREALLTGHASNVSAIDVAPNGEFVVSGDWDGRSKIWSTASWTAQFSLLGPDPADKQRAIWAVLAYSNTVVFTGSADHVIRGYSLQNTPAQTAGQATDLHPGVIIRTPDVVRALCRVRKHPSGAKIASAGNDFIIRLWQFDGAQVSLLHGHESFIYALDCLPTGELVSSSEDRTVRIWSGDACIQTITHPALSIWSVSVCQQNGDFVTGASDHVARVFTRNPERIAAPATLRDFAEAVQNSAIPQQQVGDVNPSTLPGLEFIETKAGTKDGQTVMINAGGNNISAYQWSAGQSQWLLVGTVVDSSQAEAVEANNPFTLETVPSAGPGARVATPTVGHPLGSSAVFATLVQSNFAPALKRITTVNSILVESTSASLALDASELAQLSVLVQTLTEEIPRIPTAISAMSRLSIQTFAVDSTSIELVLKLATSWSYKDRLPGLDLLRCMAVSPAVAAFTNGDGKSVLDLLLPSVLSFPTDAKTRLPLDPKAVENNSMMVLRLVANMFVTVAGQQLVSKNADAVVSFLSSVLDLPKCKNRNVMIALASVASNMTALALREQETLGKPLANKNALVGLIKVLSVPIVDLADGEVVYRSLVALANLISIPGGAFAKNVQSANALTWVRTAVGKTGEERIDSIAQTISALLG